MRLLFEQLFPQCRNAVVTGMLLLLCFAAFVVQSIAQDSTNNGNGLIRSGNIAAVADIEVFYDLQCGSCVRFHSVLKKAEAKFGNKIVVTFRHFPLAIPAHDKAIMAARMVEAARLQGEGRQMLDLVLASQTKWSSAVQAKRILFNYAIKLKLNMPKFREDFEDEMLLHKIFNDRFRANELKLNSTPTVFLNGKQLAFSELMDIETHIKEIVK